MLYHFLLSVHVVACVLMILVVLLQTGRGAGLAVFGGGGDSLITTPTGSSFMRNFTSVLAGTFAFTSLLLTLLSTRAGLGSVTARIPAPAPMQAPAAPAAPQAPAPAAPAVPK
jgi:preprotein translocase subunit SecG